MNLIQKLQAKGVKVYSGQPLWEHTSNITTIKVGENAVVTESNRYDGHTLVIEEGESTVYLPLKYGTSPEKAEYTVAEYAATRDNAEYGITSGETKVFAV